ncbi:hypothetical protein ACTQ05_09600, partial [Collinsella sp. LCP21S3_A9]
MTGIGENTLAQPVKPPLRERRACLAKLVKNRLTLTMRRKRRPYSSYAGEPTPAPPNLVRRDFRSALPNFLWL